MSYKTRGNYSSGAKECSPNCQCYICYLERKENKEKEESKKKEYNK